MTGPHPHNWPETWRDDGKCIVKSCHVRRGKYCDACDKRVYLVQDADGERFLVAHDGTRWCR
jgi:hypothetical protein